MGKTETNTPRKYVEPDDLVPGAKFVMEAVRNHPEPVTVVGVRTHGYNWSDVVYTLDRHPEMGEFKCAIGSFLCFVQFPQRGTGEAAQEKRGR